MSRYLALGSFPVVTLGTLIAVNFLGLADKLFPRYAEFLSPLPRTFRRLWLALVIYTAMILMGGILSFTVIPSFMAGWLSIASVTGTLAAVGLLAVVSAYIYAVSVRKED